MILMRWAILGIIIELIGFYFLFGGFLNAALAFFKSLPYVGYIFTMISFLIPKTKEKTD